MTNERTKQLVDQFAQDLLTASGYDMREYSPFLVEAEKFAELIVRECAGLLDGEWEKEILSGSDAAGILKQHFGVEE